VIVLQEILASLVSLLIVDPLQAEMSERLAQVRAPQAVIADVRTCAEASLPTLADRAMAEPMWVVSTALNVWTGQATPESILGSTPQCESALKSARVYLESRGA
jgi:P2-related tail formation protein